MSHPYPLQPGDRSSDLSSRDSSLAGDRRPDSVGGNNAAPSLTSPETPLWRAGQLAPVRHTPPFAPIEMQGDTSGEGTEVRELDIYKYGDDYDPTAPMRVREVGSNWSVDTDFDGEKN